MQNLPISINGDTELEAYENYLTEQKQSNSTGMSVVNNNMSYIPSENNIVPSSLKNSAFMPSFLSKHIGKLIRAESLIGDRLETKTGILLNVGAGFMVLRQLRSNNTVICDLFAVKYITVVHDNDPRKLLP